MVDTKEKAYWLGFLYADGCVNRYKGGGIRLDLTLSVKDEAWLDKFLHTVGANLERKLYQRSDKKRGIQICNWRFVGHLLAHGCGERKTLTVDLPDLGDENLDLSFLLGYFDGDGTVSCGNPRISCGSRDFLLSVKAKYGIGYHITTGKGHTLSLHVGRWLYQRMTDNYPHSMPRKRVALDPSIPRRSKYDPSILRGAHRNPANGSRTHCPQGHPYDKANTYVHQGRRHCRLCNAERQANYRCRKKERDPP